MVRSHKDRQPRNVTPHAWQTETDAAERQHLDELLEEGLKGTFPASDPVAVVQQPPEPPTATEPRRGRAASNLRP